MLKGHSEVEIKVSVYNECVGDFYDTLNCFIKGLGLNKFPVNVKVRGNPIQLAPYQSGIKYNLDPPIIKVGYVLKNVNESNKRFKLINTGNNRILIKWKIYDYDDIIKPNRNIVDLKIIERSSENDFKFTNDENIKNYSYKFDYSAVEPNELIRKYFLITPIEGTIEPKGSIEFNIKFITDKEGIKSGLLLANLIFNEKSISNIKMSELAIKLDGFGISPKITVDEYPDINGNITYEFIQHSSFVNKYDLKYLNNSNFVNSYSSSNYNINQKKSIILINKEKIEFKIKTIIEGSYKIINVVPKESKLSDNIYSIIPGSNIKLEVKYIAPNINDETEWPMTLINESFGIMKILYENGDYQEFKLKTTLKRPKISISYLSNEVILKKSIKLKDNLYNINYSNDNDLNTESNINSPISSTKNLANIKNNYLNINYKFNDKQVLDFGFINIQSHEEAEFYIINETDVGTSFEIKYYKANINKTYGYATTTEEEKENISSVDDPSVFTFNKTDGFIFGPSNLLKIMPNGQELYKKDDFRFDYMKPIKIKLIFKVRKLFL